ncbi:superoxide dismutase family protein [Novosphingobium sp. RD2P27]|uniref:Superoxide dismutase family protein n=1 Tax=Novosphingobium kalidii TaxID=3230299 RepID=A0ABV2CYW3_9SPHN
MNRFATFVCAAAVFGAGPALAQSNATKPGPHGVVHASVIGADGRDHGVVTLKDTPHGVLVTTNLNGLPEGEHGFHFHEKGMCEPQQKFTTAGGHYAPGGSKHGFMVEQGPHGGDMPNQHVGASGKLVSEVLNTGVTLADGPRTLFDMDGSALVIHAKPDDYKSQPSGDAGDRIACAVLAAPKK